MFCQTFFPEAPTAVGLAEHIGLPLLSAMEAVARLPSLPGDVLPDFWHQRSKQGEDANPAAKGGLNNSQWLGEGEAIAAYIAGVAKTVLQELRAASKWEECVDAQLPRTSDWTEVLRLCSEGIYGAVLPPAMLQYLHQSESLHTSSNTFLLVTAGFALFLMAIISCVYHVHFPGKQGAPGQGTFEMT